MSAPCKPTTAGVVLCPFWKDNTRSTDIHCEGLTANSIIVQRHRTIGASKQYKRDFCMEAYKTCPIYRMIMQAKYHEEART